jgi:hypothetical protein
MIAMADFVMLWVEHMEGYAGVMTGMRCPMSRRSDLGFHTL